MVKGIKGTEYDARLRELGLERWRAQAPSRHAYDAQDNAWKLWAGPGSVVRDSRGGRTNEAEHGRPSQHTAEKWTPGIKKELFLNQSQKQLEQNPMGKEKTLRARLQSCIPEIQIGTDTPCKLEMEGKERERM
jgi:hypothetical protein